MDKNMYFYEGPVMEFGTLVTNHWRSSTYAVSEGRARTNLEHQFKVSNNRTKNAKITLPGKIKTV